MRFTATGRGLAAVVLLASLATWGISTSNGADRPAPRSFSGIVLRIEFLFPERRSIHLGTGFIVQDRRQEKYLMTCAHLVDEREWQSRYKLTMRTMRGDKRIESYGTSLHIGQSVDLRKTEANGQPDMTRDLVIRPVAGDWAKPLVLAKNDPQPGDWVWAVGCETHAPVSDEKLFPGRIAEVSNGGYTMRKAVRFNPKGFSGGPLVNQKGEVVGNVLAGGQDIVGGATVSSLRRRLRENGVLVD